MNMPSSVVSRGIQDGFQPESICRSYEEFSLTANEEQQEDEAGSEIFILMRRQVACSFPENENTFSGIERSALLLAGWQCCSGNLPPPHRI